MERNQADQVATRAAERQWMEDELRARVEAAERVLHLYFDGVEAKPRSGRRPAIAEAEMTGDVKSDEGGNRSAGFWILVIARTFLWLGWVGTIYRELFARKRN